LRAVCLQLSLGVAALFGPHVGGAMSQGGGGAMHEGGAMSRHVDCISSRLEIPHVTSGVEWSTSVGQWRDDQLFTVNVHPAGRQLSRVYVDLIRLFHWNRFCVVFTNGRGIRFSRVISV